MNYVQDLTSWGITRELLENLCILFTLITLLSQYFRSKILEINESKSGLRFGVFLFSLLALITMQLPIPVPHTEGILFDLRLSIIVLATAYLGVKGGLAIALFTVIIRSVSGGIGATWWGSSVFFLVILSYLIMRSISRRQTALIVAGITTAAAHMGVLCVFSLFTTKVDYISPYVSLENFIRLSLSFIIATPLSIVVLNNTLRNILKFENHYSELKSKANIDGLTSMTNYRHFHELFDKVLQTKDAYPLSVLMIDIDHFKKYNDTYGHVEGNAALRITADAITACVRHGDIVARYGGEEFIAVLPRTDSQSAYNIAERIRRMVAETRYPRSKVTVSIGVATCYDTDCSNKTSMIAAADTMLYAAKQAGRNRIEIIT